MTSSSSNKLLLHFCTLGIPSLDYMFAITKTSRKQIKTQSCELIASNSLGLFLRNMSIFSPTSVMRSPFLQKERMQTHPLPIISPIPLLSQSDPSGRNITANTAARMVITLTSAVI